MLTFKSAISAFAVTCALCAAGTTAAETYFMVVPAPNKKPAPSAIQVELTAAQLPNARSGERYEYSLHNHLRVIGDPSYRDIDVVFQPRSVLPEGLSLANNGMLTGTVAVTEHKRAVLSVQAAYKGKVDAAEFSIEMLAAEPATIEIYGFGRRWTDGTYAQSCNDYLNPPDGKSYRGATGSGVYTLQPSGGARTDAYCDMVRDGGGWTLVLNVGRNNHFAENFTHGTNLPVALSPISTTSSGALGIDRWLNAFPFTRARIAVIAGDDPNTVATFYKTITGENVRTWTTRQTETMATRTCTDANLTQNCTTRPFEFVGNMVFMWGVELPKYGYSVINDTHPVHGNFDGLTSGFCSVTTNLNDNAWPDSHGDGHWGNGLMIWMR